MCMSSADDTDEHFQQFAKIWQFVNFHCHNWLQHEICTKMSTNKPSIGAVFLEIALVIFKQNCQFSIFMHENCSLCVKTLFYFLRPIAKNTCLVLVVIEICHRREEEEPGGRYGCKTW